MPTKLNKAGNQQNYVPAGNGDASGEYGDNATGSNKHFKSFSKENGNNTQPKETRWNELSKKQKKEIGMYVFHNQKFEDNKALVDDLRYYTESFGDLKNYSDDELTDIINKIKDIKSSDENEALYFKEGGKWKITYYPKELLDEIGVKAYTIEEKNAKEIEDATKTLESSQTPQDKEIKNIMGSGCEVCFGKGYSKDDLDQIVKDTENITNDFSELKGFVKNIGDRNNLEKLINAKRAAKEPTEEEIQNEIARLKRFVNYPSLTDEEKEARFRTEALRRLKQPVKIASLSRAYAYWDSSNKSVVFMGKMKNLEDKQKDYEYNSNFKSSNKRNATFAHEMGHAVDYMVQDFYKRKQAGVNPITDYDRYRELGIKKTEYENKLQELYSQNFNADYRKQFNQEYESGFGIPYDSWDINDYQKEKQKELIERQLFHKGIKQYNLSKYGNTNKEEFIAESFSAYYTGMNNPLANEVVKTVKDFYEYLKNF